MVYALDFDHTKDALRCCAEWHFLIKLINGGTKMMKQTKCALGIALLSGAGLLISADGLAQAESPRVAATSEAKQRDDFARLLDSAKGLNQALKRVSEQRKVDNSRVLRESEQKISKAEAEAAAGKMLDARLLLDDAYLGTKLAIVDLAKKAPAAAASPAPVADAVTPKQQKDYAARMESTKALRDALERIAKEKNDGKGKAEVPVIDKLMRDADADVAQNKAKQGRALLDHAYLRAKVQIERLRGGETLVRALHFDTPEDEYHYELDRNDTFRMLVQLLVPDENASDARMKGFLERARSLRSEADGKSVRHEYEDALKTIEESTREYQKVIRNAGVMIPG